MTNERIVVRGTVKMIICQSCNSKMPLFAFETETDVGAVGLCSATRCNGLELIIAETTLDEWKQMKSGELQHLPARLSDALDIRGLHVLHIVRVEEQPESAAGMPFSEFRKIYRRPRVIYSCPCCEKG